MPTAAISQLALFALCAAFAAVTPVAAAETYPSKPIRIIVTGTPGGPPDLLTRWLAERLAPALGGVFVVENRPGAGGNVAMQAAARSAPDGYTLVVAGQGPFALNPHMYTKPGYNTNTDFAPITQIERGALLLAVNPEVPVHSVGKLIALANKRPGELNYGSPGMGTPPPIIERLQREIAVIVLTDEARRYFASYGREPVASTPAAFAAFIRSEHAKWGRVIRDSNIKAE